MEETIINEPSLFQTLVLSPTTYIVLVIIALTIVGLKKGKSSPKCCEPNKTSTPSTPKRARNKGKFVADDPKTPQNEAWVGGKAPKRKPTKKTSAKKTPIKRKATKKAVIKRTPKKSGK
jgi:hypothetical protein